MYGLAGILSKTKSSSINSGLRLYMIGVYNYMTLALGVSGLTAFFLAKTGLAIKIATGPLGLILAFLPVGISFYMSAKLMKARMETIKNLFFIYAISMGASLSVLFLMFTATDIARAFFITASTFGAMSLYGYTTEKDLSSMSSYLTMAVLGLFIASIVNIFMHSSAMSFFISFVSVIVFTILVAYDTQNIKKMYYATNGNKDNATRVAIFGALQLYMDFVVIFIHLLQLLGFNKNRD